MENAENPLMNELAHWLEQAGEGNIVQCQPLSGGDVCRTEKIRTSNGAVFCVKHQPTAPERFFAAEAEGLAALRASNCLRVPDVYAVAPHFIVMEYIEPGRRTTEYWEALGIQLAQQHRQPMPAFGFTADNFCGHTAQPNPRYKDGWSFFADQRLRYQAALAVNQGRLSRREMDALHKLCDKLPSLIPEAAPALIHGDLWVGNIHCDRDNKPVLIDPAAYWGWPEADIAMTRLFGGFSELFYRAYLEANPLARGWQERIPLYNLYHLLNHLNLFGSSYHPQVLAVLERYVKV